MKNGRNYAGSLTKHVATASTFPPVCRDTATRQSTGTVVGARLVQQQPQRHAERDASVRWSVLRPLTAHVHAGGECETTSFVPPGTWTRMSRLTGLGARSSGGAFPNRDS